MQHVRELLSAEIERLESEKSKVKAALDALASTPAKAVEAPKQERKPRQRKAKAKVPPSSGHPNVERRVPKPEKLGSAPAVPENLDRVYDAIVEIGAAATEQEIRDACGMAEKATKCLQVLIERGKVVQIGKARGTKYAVIGTQVTNWDDTELDSEAAE